MDNKIAYIGGFLLSTLTSISILGIVNAAIVGLGRWFFWKFRLYRNKERELILLERIKKRDKERELKQ